MYLLPRVLNFGLFFFNEFYTVLYRKKCKKDFVQRTEEAMSPKEIFYKLFFFLTIIYNVWKNKMKACPLINLIVLELHNVLLLANIVLLHGETLIITIITTTSSQGPGRCFHLTCLRLLWICYLFSTRLIFVPFHHSI